MNSERRKKLESMKQMLLASLLVAVAGFGTTAYANTEQGATICTGKTPVKLFVSFVYIDQNGTRPNFGNAIMCWEKEVESEDDLTRLHAAFKPHKKGDVTTILGFTTLRK